MLHPLRASRSRRSFLAACAALAVSALVPGGMAAQPPETLTVLFIGNSFTGRHTLSAVVKAMAEAGNPGLKLEVTTLLYGGRTLKDHWRLGTQNFVNHTTLKPAEVEATLAALKESVARDPADSYAKQAITRQQELLGRLGAPRRKWDIVVLQSYRDDTQGAASSYLEYAPRFAALVKAQGGRTVLYETTPDTQHATALVAAPDRAPVLAKAKLIAALAARLDAATVPMSLVALHCQTRRPDLTLRFVNDAHLNQTMAYLTACAFQAALFGRSPEGLALDTVTDTRYLDAAHRDKDRDNQPIKRIFSARDRADLQRAAWEGHQEFLRLVAAAK
ncbi:MAG: hypothetical protein JNL92_14365 [Opitutaceae bacterium]|nr:hypothetical protein [Opitutaceae bacterium]